MSIRAWQQFATIDIEFHPRLTVLTGANGSGKTTLLRILAQHKGWPSVHLSTPAKNRLTGAIEFFTRLFRGKDQSSNEHLGNIAYSSGQQAALVIPNGDSRPTYGIAIDNLQPVMCFFIPSHRQTYRYEALQNIPIGKKNEQTAFDEVHGTAMQRFQGSGGQSTSFFIKHTLIGWAIQGYGVRSNSKTIMLADKQLVEAFEGFQEALRKLLPPILGFNELEIRGMEIVFVCNNGQDEFMLETASGGVATLIDFAWQIFMFARANPGTFTVIIDEVENHLHPTLQRALLPNLLSAFPQAAFIVSTHSPLIVGSVRDSSVYVLRYNSDKKIESQKLDLEDKAMTATEILDEVLGVSSSLPIWVETELTRILTDVSSGGVTEATFSRLRGHLKEAGLEHLLPEAMTTVLQGKA
jgi:AAA domain, putative AbiEii toxin, Type IV TA system/AAA domain